MNFTIQTSKLIFHRFLVSYLSFDNFNLHLHAYFTYDIQVLLYQTLHILQ